MSLSRIALVSLLLAFASYAATPPSTKITRLDISSTSSFNLPFAGDGEKTMKERAGVALSTKDCSARVYGYTDTISFDKGDSFFTSLNSPMWGVGLHLNRLFSLPLQFQLGTLTIGGTLSRLRSPALSSPSIFSSTFSLPKGLEVSLPSLTSSKKPVAASFLCETNTDKLTTRVCAIADEDGAASSSLSLTAALPRMMKTGVCVTGGMFPIKDKKAHTSNPQWYGIDPYFLDGRFGALSIQTYFDSPLATCILTANVYDEPNKDTAFTGRGEAALHSGVFSLRNAIFFVNNPFTIDIDGGYVKKTFQLMTQPLITLHPSRERLSTLSFGAFVFLQRYDEERDTKGRMYEYTILNSTAGVKYTDRRISAQATFSVKNIPITGTSNEDSTEDITYKASINGSITSRTVRNTARASVEFTPNTSAVTTNATLGIAAGKKNASIDSNAGIESSHLKSGSNTLSINAAVKAVMKKKPLRVIVTLAAKSRVL